MRARDLAELVLLGALWGASFLFMRIAAPAFGAFGLVALRVAGAALLLLPLLAARGGLGSLRRHWRPIAWVGLANSALPFLGFAQAALTLNAALSSILNATAPLFGALIAMFWWHEPSDPRRLAGLVLGFAGVAGLVGGQAGLRSGAGAADALLAVSLCLGAAALYGASANFARHRLVGVDPLAVAAGSQVAATLLVVGPAWWAWPVAPVSPAAWLAAAALALGCTGLAYLLYFRLIAHVGSTRALSVTYLVPVFAMLWGWMFLGETVTAAMLGCGLLILAGVGLSSGAWPRPRPRHEAP